MTVPSRVLGLACTVLLALTACSKPAQPQMPTPEVGIVEAKPQTTPIQLDLVGRLSAYRSADVRARVAGVLQKRIYTEGTEVKEGQPLFQIDPAPFKAVLSEAQGRLTAAEATYKNAKIVADRARRLSPEQYVSRSDVDNAEATERTAAASVQQARAAVESARINLSYANVTAPISGRAGQQQVTEGALVGSGSSTLLTTVDQIDPLYVNFSISNDELLQLRQAQHQGSVQLSSGGTSTVDVLLSDGSKYAHSGTLDFSGATVDPRTGTVSLRAVLPNSDHLLLPGAFVTFKATLGQRSNTILLPGTSVQRDTTGAYVLVIGKDGKVMRKNVTTTGLQNGQWLITAGLSTGDQVIVDGIQKVKEGIPAKSTPWKPSAFNPNTSHAQANKPTNAAKTEQ
ncbi:efflux RND transporter periplasmic adaptor subunit [Xylella taiwanensis]|uniref:Efflux RND transporter periplasmic adaptor subunit n=1 Tax=Xylella taiwanensis TaxID=1444770 RepID=Z9JN07_9GAMM|nr:efflux RND transporter periplasmic adaptor subunit [Xylella taiwanensis]AXI83353.1 GntR family transcriptional regulator [Xylella taiwanensis]EWS79127.1 GntR family transcriptional regulator [Xylella taiwanensis]MCD8456418.1 efflux RND transporter periplasmic adaptor subunit [Xylella taiwanensis]MCD8458826.1 efflux RND transporter periplasmic adaptor subunit [Xylella taiwanensis]MCD8460962.1 efflux RND transporter periplasmic adaptor subunit [Xylella taiwanensis]